MSRVFRQSDVARAIRTEGQTLIAKMRECVKCNRFGPGMQPCSVHLPKAVDLHERWMVALNDGEFA